MRERPPPPPPDDVPLWFTTYSDVITLMMTFFILLLTFATSEPERFEQMKIAVFGSSGAPGIVGQKLAGTEKDSWSMRVRPRSARLTDRGAELPPVNGAGSSESVKEGLAGLEDEQTRQIVNLMTVVVPGNSLGSSTGELYDYGQHNMKMLANMIRTKSCEVVFEVSGGNQLNRALACIQFLYHDQAIPADQLSVCQDRFPDLSNDNIRMILRNYESYNNVRAQEKTAQ
jgi:flagellar motor protein MotB